jgi:hypothetical protein
MKKNYLIMSAFAISLVLSILMVEIPGDLNIPFYARNLENMFSIIAMSAIIVAWCLFGLLTLKYEYNEIKNEKNFIIFSLVISFISIISVFYIQKTNFYKEYKEKILIEMISKMPETTEVINSRNLIINHNFKELSELSSKIYIYIDPMNVAIDVKSYNNEVLNSYFNNVMADGYMSLADKELIYEKMNNLMIEELRRI